MTQGLAVAPFYVSNDGERTLAALLNGAIRHLSQRRLDVASGYFKPEVWNLVGGAFKELDRFRLLLGSEPMTGGNPSGLDLAEHFRRRIQGDLEDLIFDRGHASTIDDLIAFLRRASVEVRMYNPKAPGASQFLHAKAFIFPTISVVGSSNLTPAGLTTNAELNLVRTDEPAANDLRSWFNSRWEPPFATDYKDEMIRVLEESKFGDYPWSPYQVFIKALWEYFRDRLRPEDALPVAGEPLDLASFQQEGAQEAEWLLDSHRGAIVADATGLGKTFIGLEVMRRYFVKLLQRVRRPRFLVVCPAQLKSLVWDGAVANNLPFRVDVVTMESLGREDFDSRRYINHDFILVDEAHNFRNPGTRRYENLMTVIGTGKLDKYVLLMTATPINTSVYDFYHQVLLLARNRQDHYALDGISNLEGYFRRMAKEGAGMLDIIRLTTVRRTRHDIRRRQAQGEKIIIRGEEVRFPQQPPPEAVLYDLAASYGGFYDDVIDHIEKLTLAPYRHAAYLRKADAEQQKEVLRQEALAGIFKTTFLKRLESSVKAFQTTVRDQAQFQREFLRYLVERKKVLDAPSYRRIRQFMKSEDDEQTARVEEMVKALDEVEADVYDLDKLRADVERDVEHLEGIIAALDIITERGSADAKLEAVKQYIAGRLQGRIKERKLLVFSYFRETAEYVAEQLSADTEWLARMGNPELAVITGSTDGERRKTIVNRFAPMSNRRDEDDDSNWQPPADPIDILISTDVLSEGQNLQDCAELLNYDLHWNPVRMIQRAGRINRLRSLHEEVYIGNCFPDRDLETLLGIVRRLSNRIRDIDQSVGLDHSVMGEVISEKSFVDLRRIRASDPTVVGELEDLSELASLEDMKLPLQLFFKEEGESELQRIPLGIRSARLGQKKGTFLAFKVPVGDRDHHFWRFYPDDEAPPLTDMRDIYALVRCGRNEPRVSVPSPDNPAREDRRFEVVERATADILHELRGRRGVAVAPYRMIALERSYWNVLEQPGLGEDVDAEMRHRVMNALGRGSFRPLHRKAEWRELQAKWRQNHNHLDSATLAAALDQMATVWGLYNDLDFGAPGALAAINEEQLRLVCYELIV